MGARWVRWALAVVGVCVMGGAVRGAGGATTGFSLGGGKVEMSAVAFSPDGKFAAGVLANGEVHVWEMASKRRCYVVSVGTPAYCALFSRDGTEIYVGEKDGGTARIELATGKVVGGMGNTTGNVTAIALSPQGDHVALGTHRGTVVVKDLPKLAKSDTGGSYGKEAVVLVAWEGNNRLVSVDETGVWKAWTLTAKGVVRAVKERPAPNGEMGAGPMAVNGDKSVLGVVTNGEKGGRLMLYRWADRKALDSAAAVILPEGVKGNGAAFSADGLTVAVSGSDGKAYFKDISGVLKKAGMTVPEGGNPLMGPREGQDWPALATVLRAQANWRGAEDQRSGLQIQVTSAEPLMVGVRRVENGKVTDAGRDGRFEPGKEYLMEFPPATYEVYWRKLMEPGEIHKGPLVEVYFREYDVAQENVHVTEWMPLRVTFDGKTATASRGDPKKETSMHDRK